MCGFSLNDMGQSDTNLHKHAASCKQDVDSVKMAHLPAPPCDRFRAGRIIFQRFESNHCKKLYREGWSVREIQQMYYKRCTINEIIVAIRVAICVEFANWYEALDNQIFNVRNINFDQWIIGRPFFMLSPRFMSSLQGQYSGLGTL